MLNILSALAAPVTGVIGKVVDAKAKKTQGELDIEATKIVTTAQAVKDKLDAGLQVTKADIDLANTSRRDWQGSWKDEWVLVMLSIPLMAYFFSAWFPPLEQAADKMVGAFKGQYHVVMVSVMLTIYGIRKMFGR